MYGLLMDFILFIQPQMKKLGPTFRDFILLEHFCENKVYLWGWLLHQKNWIQFLNLHWESFPTHNVIRLLALLKVPLGGICTLFTK